MKYIYLILILFFSIGCTNNPKTPLHVESLEQLILDIDKSIHKEDAKLLSQEMLAYSQQLKKEYQLVSPPLYHNFLVNIGAKNRGLCWHFAYDMLSHAKELKLSSFDFYIGGANIDDYWEEHNSLVVTCKKCSFSKGVVLDPWRNSGDLYFSNVKNDKKYIWTQRGGLR